MRRRLLLGAAVGAPALLQGCALSAVQTFPDLASARRALAALAAPPARPWRSSGAWDLAQVLHHAAQSVEYSMVGFPQPKPALFRHTVGRAAFAVFDARGQMSHGLAEAIPGAPDIARGQPLQGAVDRLLKALDAFEQHQGPLAPHFAYGVLDKAQFTRAHLLHLANHWTEVVQS